MRALAALLLTSLAAAGRADELGDRLEARLAAHPELAGARVGVAVLDVATGQPLFRHAADEGFNLASNAKIVTGAAALALLGPAYTWKTVLLADKLAGDEIQGNLYLRAGGDPTLDAAALWDLAERLRRLGVTRVTGSLIIDDGFFDAGVMPPAFDQKQEDDGFRAAVSAASLNYNAVAVHVQPGAADGAPARVTISPAQDYVTVKNGAVTVAEGKTQLEIRARGAEVSVSGTIRLTDADGEVARKRVDDPTAFFTAAFRRALAAAGVKLRGRAKRGATPAGAVVLARRESAPLGSVLRDMEKHSNNMIAEDVLRTLGAETTGAPGSWAAGTAAVAGWLDQNGIPAGSYRYENGSGLYDSNRFTPLQVACILRLSWLDFRIGPDLAGSLAVAGTDGTLARRMVGGAAERYVRAKSGTLAGAITLSGYVGAVGKPLLAFSILVNGVEKEAGRNGARELEDEVAEELARWVEGK